MKYAGQDKVFGAESFDLEKVPHLKKFYASLHIVLEINNS